MLRTVLILGGTYVGGFSDSRAARRAGGNSNNLKDSWLWQNLKGIPESSCEAIVLFLFLGTTKVE
jgi:hypothetical protein